MILQYHQSVNTLDHRRTLGDPSSSHTILPRQRTLINPNQIPRTLWSYPQFVTWRYVDNGKPKFDKCPTNPITLGNAGVTWPNTWTDIRTAVRVYQDNPHLAGIGFVLTRNDPYVAIDLDGCLTDGNLSPLAGEIVNTLATYTEISPSGHGLRLIVRYPHPVTLKRSEIELYSMGRWVTLTGNVFLDRPIADAGDLAWLIDRYPKTATTTPGETQGRAFSPTPDDAALWDRMFNSKKGALIKRLYDGVTTGFASHSEADESLCSRLKFFTGNDLERVDRMFRQSGLYRDKWDRLVNANQTYGQRTIARARSTQVYTGGAK